MSTSNPDDRNPTASSPSSEGDESSRRSDAANPRTRVVITYHPGSTDVSSSQYSSRPSSGSTWSYEPMPEFEPRMVDAEPPSPGILTPTLGPPAGIFLSESVVTDSDDYYSSPRGSSPTYENTGSQQPPLPPRLTMSNPRPMVTLHFQSQRQEAQNLNLQLVSREDYAPSDEDDETGYESVLERFMSFAPNGEVRTVEQSIVAQMRPGTDQLIETIRSSAERSLSALPHPLPRNFDLYPALHWYAR